MAPTIIAPSATVGNASSATVAGSASLVAGDRRYIAVTVSSGPSASTPTGWTLTHDVQVGTSATRRLYLFERDAVGADGSTTITFSGATNYSATTWATRGGLATIVGPSSTTAETGTAMTAPGQTVTVADSLLIDLFVSLNSSSTVANTTPAGMTSLVSVTPGGSGHVVRLANEVRAATGATGTRESTAQISSRWAALSIVVHSSGVAPDPIWTGDFETGDFSQLGNPSGGIDQLSPQTRTIVTTPIRRGLYACEFAVTGVAASNGTQRSEGRASGLNFAEGDDRWIAGSYYLPSGFPINPGQFQAVMQLKTDVGTSPPVGLYIENSRFELQGGFGHPTTSNPMTVQDLGTPLTGVWTDFLFHVKFSTDPAIGEISVWRDGVLKVNALKPPGGTMYPGSPAASYLKFGLYRDPSLATGSATKVTVDEWRVGTTRAAVELSDTNVQAAAAITGAATVAATATQTHRAVAAITGAATVAATATQTHQAVAAVTGAATVAATAMGTVPAAASVSGVATVGATATREQFASAAVTGAATVVATVGGSGAAAITGAATVAATATQTHQAVAAVTGAATVAATADQDHLIAAAVTGAATVNGQVHSDQPIATAVTGVATVGATATRVHAARAAILATALVSADAVRAAAATATITGVATVSAGAVGAAAGSLNVALFAVDRDGGALTPLPRWSKLSLARIRNSPGALSVDYPANAPGFSTLRANVTADRDLEVEVWLGGRVSTAVRGILHTAQGDDVNERAVWTFTGSFLEQLLAESVVFNQPAAEKQELRFSAATAGAIGSTLLTQAQARGGLTGMTKDFTATLDSSGRAWPEFATIKFSPGADLLAVSQRLVELGLCEFEVTAGRVWRMWAPGRMGADRTTGTTPTIIRRGRNVTESPRRHSVRESVTALLGAGAEGIYASSSDATALARRGRRIEGTASSNNLTDLGAVQAFNGKQLAVRTPGEMELLLGLSFGTGHPRPGTHFSVSDWVLADSVGTLERLRVVQWTLELDSSAPHGSVTLNDLRTDWRIRAERRLNALASGDVVIGTSTQSPGKDSVAPGAPTGITLGSTAYQSTTGTDLATVTVGWTAPASNADGSALFDLAGFRARYRFSSPEWQLTPDASAQASSLTISDQQAGANVEVQVQAFDRDGNASVWSSSANHTTEADTTAPPVPSTPDLSPYLGQLRIRWDGKGVGGVVMALDLDRVEIHLSTVNNFTPTPATLIDNFGSPTAGERIATDLTYGTRYYVRLIAIDLTGNASAPSGVASSTPERVVSLDVFDGAIGTAKLAELAVTTAKINLLAVNDAQIGNLSVGKLTAGTMTASVIIGGVFRTATTGRRMEIDSGGWRGFKVDGVTKFAELSLTGETMLMTGTYQSGITGERIHILPDGSLRMYGASGADYAQMANDSGIVRFRSRADASNRRSFVELNPAGVNIYYGVTAGDYTGARSGLDSGLTYGVIRAPVCGARMLTQFTPGDATEHRFFTVFAGTAGDFGDSVFHFLRASSGRGILIGASADAGIKPQGGVVEIVKGSGMTFAPCRGESFLVGSSKLTKQKIRSAREGLGRSAGDVVRGARAKAWERTPEALPPRPAKPGHKLRKIDHNADGIEVESYVDAQWDWPEPPRRQQFGPIAEEVVVYAPSLVVADLTGDLSLDIGGIASMGWEAAAEAHDRLDALIARLDATSVFRNPK